MNPGLISSLGFVRVAAVSPDLHVADISFNIDQLTASFDAMIGQGADVVVSPELSITGYTLGDLVRFPDLLHGALRGLDQIRHWSTGRSALIVVGLPMEVQGALYNCAAVLQDGHLRAVVPKTFLPTTREFYDHRWFKSGAEAQADHVRIGHVDVPFGPDLLIVDEDDPSYQIGIEICEDLWSVIPPSSTMSMAGATLMLNLSASNEVVGKAQYRRDLVLGQSARTYSAYVYASSGPGESTTDTVFSGHCMIAENGIMLTESQRLQLSGTHVIADVDLQHLVTERLNASSFSQHVPVDPYRRVVLRLDRTRRNSILRPISPLPFVPNDEEHRAQRCREIVQLQATALAVRMRHTRSKKMVIGVSGGLDSTLALLVCEEACDLLGMDHTAIVAVSMPGFGTTSRTRENAHRLIERVGAEFREIDITPAVLQHFRDLGHDENDHSVVYENAQARERTQILMNVANQVGGLVIGTGDMSELALGWCTYNADHMSMYNVNSGVPKTLVRYVIEWFSTSRADEGLQAALKDILDTPISPELLPPSGEGGIVQRTEDLLGPYEVHDFFLYEFVRMQRPVKTVVVLAITAFADRYSEHQVLNWCKVFLERFFSQQFKRSTLPDGVKIGSVCLSPRADWRMPSDARADVWLRELESIL